MRIIFKRAGIGLGLLLLLSGSFLYVTGKRGAASPSAHQQHNLPQQASPSTGIEKPMDDDKRVKLATMRAFFNSKTRNLKNNSEPIRKLSPQEVSDIEEAQAICAELMNALDEDNTLAILAKARTLIKHPNPEVRQRVLDAFNWVGRDALYDLVEMLDDENSEIAKAATESFWEQVAALPNDPAKLKLLEGFSNSQDPDMLSHLAEELSNYHPHMAYDLILSILSVSPNTVHEDLQWELEGITGESFETTPEWKKWFIENKSSLEADYKDQDF